MFFVYFFNTYANNCTSCNNGFDTVAARAEISDQNRITIPVEIRTTLSFGG